MHGSDFHPTSTTPAGRHVGTMVKTRVAFQRWHGSPLVRIAIVTRWLFWLALGWPLTTVATTGLLIWFGLTVPILLGIALITGLWAATIDTAKTIALLVAVASFTATVAWVAAGSGLGGRLGLIALFALWPLDGLLSSWFNRMRLWRWWCEVRRGFSMRYAVMAAKSTQIQGVIDGEQQLADGQRPILDQPALSITAYFDGDTAWSQCSVPPGRSVEALEEVIQELSASFVRVERMDLVFTDDHQSFGYLVVRFGYSRLAGDGPAMPGARLAELAYLAAPYTGLALAGFAVAWVSIAAVGGI